jgi:hypothetical protein
MSDHTTTLRALPPPAASSLERLAELLQSRLSTALAVGLMWTLAMIDWLSIYAGNAPNRKIFAAILVMAGVLAAGRIRLALTRKPR